MKLIVRADDMGYSEAYNYGYYEAIKNGIVTSAELMVDMPGTEHAVKLLKEFPWIPIGIHLHMCGNPCADPKLIPNLVGPDGKLQVKFTRKRDVDFPIDEMYIEAKAQIEKYIRLVGRKPDVISNISDDDTTYAKTYRKIVEEYRINYLKNSVYYKWVKTEDGWKTDSYSVKRLETGRSGEWGSILDQAELYAPEKAFLEYNEDNYKDDACYNIVFHPGYIDGFILKNSRLTVGRIKDVEACTSRKVKAKLKEENVKLITCNDLMYGTNDYQNYIKTRKYL